MDDPVVAAAFLARFGEDKLHRRELSLAEYQRLYPGFEELIAREHAGISSSASSSSRGAGAAEPAPASPGSASLASRPDFGLYRITAEIARGGQGEVFLALDTRLNRPVALKVLRDRGQFSGD